MSAGVWYGKRTWLGLGFALVLALALDALGALLLARGMVPMAAARTGRVSRCARCCSPPGYSRS